MCKATEIDSVPILSACQAMPSSVLNEIVVPALKASLLFYKV
jgi:hypothetical protein